MIKATAAGYFFAPIMGAGVHYSTGESVFFIFCFILMMFFWHIVKKEEE
jgi:hypothetical protein